MAAPDTANHQDHPGRRIATKPVAGLAGIPVRSTPQRCEASQLPQVSWIVAPAGYTEHSDWPVDYGAWYISKIVDILVSNPEVFSKTVLLINYDEADGSFDHVTPPFPPQSPDFGASTVDVHNEIVTTDTPTGLSASARGCRSCHLALDQGRLRHLAGLRSHLRHPIHREAFRRNRDKHLAVAPDGLRRSDQRIQLRNPNDSHVRLPSTEDFLPPVDELAGGTCRPSFRLRVSCSSGYPSRKRACGQRARCPMSSCVMATSTPRAAPSSIDFINTGKAGAVFQVRSGNSADKVRAYTVEHGKQLSGSGSSLSQYDLSVYGRTGSHAISRARSASSRPTSTSVLDTTRTSMAHSA